ncbi:MAG: hypothetical protein KAI26_03665 [Nanoarchaeota archaeon]|nr:hypothetical protein [Nanoarchaeota archaeon]
MGLSIFYLIFPLLGILIILFSLIFYIRKKGSVSEAPIEEQPQVTDREEQQETKLSSRITMTIVVVVIAILLLALFNAWGAANNEAKKIIRTDGSGDCEDEVYPDGVKISNVKSDSDLSFTSLQKIGKGRTNTLSFYYKGTGGNVSLVVLPLKNLPQNQINPSSFETMNLTDEWTLYEISFCAPAECQFVVILSVPEGCEGEIKDFKIK